MSFLLSHVRLSLSERITECKSVGFMAVEFDILHSGDGFLVIDKPEGFHVHAPEDRHIRVDPSKIVLQQLRRQVGERIYPVHRLDVPTSGCLLVALNSEVASVLGKQLQNQGMRKVYLGVARGWTPEDLEIGIPLESEDKTKLLESISVLRRLKTIQINAKIGKRHPQARYSLVQLEPLTGRFHQLRRHLNRISHPLVGDVAHGDRHHNHYFADHLNIMGLCLRASTMCFRDPSDSEQKIIVKAPSNEKWNRIQNLFDSECEIAKF